MTVHALPGLPLTVRDAQILELLHGSSTPRRVIEIGAYRKSWTAADVRRVVAQHMPLPPVGPRQPTPRRSVEPLRVWEPPVADGPPVDVELTAREADVLTELCRALPNKDIAAVLHLSQETVKTYVKRLLASLNVSDRTQAVALALSGRARIRVRTSTNRSTT